MKEEQGMRKAMLGWWAFLCSCLTTGSKEGLLEEGMILSLVAGVSTWGEALTSLCSCLGDGLLSVPAWVIDGLLSTPALGKGLGCLCSFLLHATRHQASLPDATFDPPSHGAVKA